jgi:cyclopropane fatty-acyl-phospholipid synthase-like methyltransferase
MPVSLNQQDIIDYYEHCQIDYEIVWHLNSRMSMHYGYWDETTPNLRSALLNMNRRLAEFGEIETGDQVLDAGCGVGGSSIYLAREYQCHTTGISLSSKQVDTCQKNALLHQMDHLCSFRQANYLDTPFPDNHFDAVWAIESVCYAYDKLDFLREAYRILKPGGKLMVADFFSNGVKENSPQEKLMQKWTSTWAIKAYADVEEFWEKMQLAGFENCQRKDISRQVEKSIRRLYYSFFPGLPITYISQALGFRNSMQTANTWSTYYQYTAYKLGLWKYMFYSARKQPLKT